MYVIVKHAVADPERFSEATRAAMAGGQPAGATLHSAYPNREGTQVICLWEASSVEAVRQVVEPVVGQTSTNEYFEVDAAKATGLPH
jgi:hypothetical protein